MDDVDENVCENGNYFSYFSLSMFSHFLVLLFYCYLVYKLGFLRFAFGGSINLTEKLVGR